MALGDLDHYLHVVERPAAHLHLHDNDRVRDRHWPPGAGAVDWRALFEALYRTARPPYFPRLLLEVKPPHTLAAAAWLADRQYVR